MNTGDFGSSKQGEILVDDGILVKDKGKEQEKDKP